MQGKLGGDETVDSLTELAAKYEKAKKEVADLEERKSNLQVEIDQAIIGAKLELEKHYANKETDLVITYQSKLDQLESQKADLKSQQEVIRKQDAEQIKQKEEISKGQEALTEGNKTLAAGLEQLTINQNNSKVQAEETNKRLEDKDLALIAKDNLLKEKESALDTREINIWDREKAIKGTEDKLAGGLNQVVIDKAELDKLLASVKEKQNVLDSLIAEATITKSNTEVEIAKVKEASRQAEDILVKNKSIAEETKKLSDSLSELRDSLTEKEVTLKEKERALLIQARDIDGKIATLQKLRKE